MSCHRLLLVALTRQSSRRAGGTDSAMTRINHLLILALLELLDELSERSKLARINQVELVNEVDEMLEACVQMRLRAQQHNMLEMSMVDVGVDSEQPFENHLDDVHEVLRKRYAESAREYFLVIQLVLYPCHEELDVLTSTDLKRRLHVVSIGPKVLVLGTCTHRWAALCRAEFHENAVQYVDFVVKLDSVYGKPLVEILSRWQLYSQLHVAATQSHPCNLLQLIAARSLLDFLLLLERLGFVETSKGLALLLFHFTL